MGWLLVLAAASASLVAADSNWGNEWAPMEGDSMLSRRSADAQQQQQQPAEDVQGRNYAVHEPTQSNATEIDTVIDQLIHSRREGRNLGEYDAVYADGNIDQALQQGNDLQARNLIRDKLCGLGLMSCDVEEKRPFYSTIYAQGPPPPSGFGGGPYGPAKPMPPPSYFNGRPPMGPPPSSLNSFGPPRKVGYEGPYKGPMNGGYRPGNQFGGAYLEHPPPSAIDGSDGISYTKPPPGAFIIDSKPPGPIYSGGPSGQMNGPVYNGPPSGSPPYNFENPERIQGASSSLNGFYSQQSSSSAATASSTKVVVGAPIDAGLQQHVHHHYHHVEGEGAHVPSVTVPIGGGQTVNTDFSALAQSSATYTPQAQASGSSFTQSNAFNAGFNGASQGGLLSQGYNPAQKPNGDSYKPTSGLGGYGSSSSGLSQSGSFGQNSYSGTPSGSYHSQNPDYYKKELQNGGGSGNYNGLSTGYGSQNQGGVYQGAGGNGGYDTSRQQIVDCQCVPISQCPAADRIGRKEDLILAIDPRNLGKDIEALNEEGASANATAKADTDVKEDKKEEEEKKRTRRQAIEENKDEDTGDLSLDAQGVSERPNLTPSD